MPKTEQSEFTKKWSRARKNIYKQYDLLEQLIMMSATSGQDRAFLLQQEPLFIIRNFIGQSLNG